MVAGAQTASILLTMDDIHRWRAEREKIDFDIAELTRKREALDKRLEAATLFVHPDKISEFSEPVTTRNVSGPVERGSWTGLIKKIVDDAGRGLTYDEMKIEAFKSPLGERLKDSTKAFYGAASKLLLSKRIFKHGDKLYSASAYERYKEAIAVGLAEDEEKIVKWRSPMAESIIKFAHEHPGGFNSTEAIDYLCLTPEFAGPIQRNPTHVYNVLNRLVRREGLVKRGKMFFPAHKDAAASNNALQKASDVAE